MREPALDPLRGCVRRNGSTTPVPRVIDRRPRVRDRHVSRRTDSIGISSGRGRTTWPRNSPAPPCRTGGCESAPRHRRPGEFRRRAPQAGQQHRQRRRAAIDRANRERPSDDDTPTPAAGIRIRRASGWIEARNHQCRPRTQGWRRDIKRRRAKPELFDTESSGELQPGQRRPRPGAAANPAATPANARRSANAKAAPAARPDNATPAAMLASSNGERIRATWSQLPCAGSGIASHRAGSTG